MFIRDRLLTKHLLKEKQNMKLILFYLFGSCDSVLQANKIVDSQNESITTEILKVIGFKDTEISHCFKAQELFAFAEDESSFFEGSVITFLDQRYREFFKSKFNCEIDELTRIDVLEIIRAQLPRIRKRLFE